MAEKWLYLGRWHAPVLCQSFFAHNYQPAVYAELKIPSIKYGYDVLAEEVYVRKDNAQLLENFFYSKMVSGDFELLNRFIIKAKERVQLIDKTKYDTETLGGFKRFVGDMLPMMAYWILVHYADPGIEKALKEKCEAKGQELYKILAQPTSAKLELFEKDKELAHLVRLHKTEKLTEEKIDAFIKKYAWTSTHAFLGAPLTRETLMRQIMLFESPLKPNVEKIELDWPELQIVQDLVWLRLKFMEIFNKVTFKFWPFLKQLAEKNNLTFEEVTAHTFKEILENRWQPNGKITERLQSFGIIIEKGDERIVSGAELQKEKKNYEVKFDLVEEITGFPACLGKAKGKARIVLSIKEVSKVQKGDILIAPETTPEFVPAMKIAGAIVTDQGGVTSHAAIISRELGVPCVIGTKVATKVFKDGDKLEVDAVKGTVRKV